MIYVYAIIEGPPDGAPPALDGVDGGRLELRDADGLTLAVSRHVRAVSGATAENVWRHEAVIEALMARRTLLPARFNTTFADEARLDAVVAANRDAMIAGLSRVRGCVELGLRALWPASERTSAATEPEPVAAPAAARSGRDYMTRLAARERRRQTAEDRAAQVADEIHSPLAALAQQSVVRPPLNADLLLSGAYLVGREDVPAFRSAVRQLADERPFLRLLCTGPWPPYHFVPSLRAGEVARG